MLVIACAEKSACTAASQNTFALTTLETEVKSSSDLGYFGSANSCSSRVQANGYQFRVTLSQSHQKKHLFLVSCNRREENV